MNQTKEFINGEADAWYCRNRAQLGKDYEEDPVFRFIERHNIKGSRVLDLGGADGHRLRELYRRGRMVDGVGIDPSGLAIQTGVALNKAEGFPISLFVGTATDMPLSVKCIEYDLVVLAFVCHWVAREDLAWTIASIDLMVAPGGAILLADFWAARPTKVPYRHREGIWTYKQRYLDCFLSLGTYQKEAELWFNHDTGELGSWFPEAQQALCSLVRKGDYYAVGKDPSDGAKP